jgi:PPM family protein phosphatase
VSSTRSAGSLSRLRYRPASGAIIGRREEQQDEARIDAFEAEGGVPALLLIVADGMGGHAGGREASRIAVDSVSRVFHAAPGAPYQARLREALEAANQAIGARAGTSRELRGMGCTLIAAVLAGNYLRWISVGDSLLLAIKDRQMIRLNADHSLAPEIDRAVREGRMSQEEADRDPDRNVLRSALTGARLSLVDEGARRLGEGALVLLATDGILTLPTARLAAMASEGKAADRTVAALLSAVEADMPSDQDNTTLVAAYCEGDLGAVRARRRHRRRLGFGLTALALAIGAGGFAAYIVIDNEGRGAEARPDRAGQPPAATPGPALQATPGTPATRGDFDGSVFNNRAAATSDRRRPARPSRPNAPTTPIAAPKPVPAAPTPPGTYPARPRETRATPGQAQPATPTPATVETDRSRVPEVPLNRQRPEDGREE